MAKMMDDPINVTLEGIEITREGVGIPNQRRVVGSRGTVLVIEIIQEEQITTETKDTHKTSTPTPRLIVLPTDLEVTRALLGRMARVTRHHVMRILLVDRWTGMEGVRQRGVAVHVVGVVEEGRH